MDLRRQIEGKGYLKLTGDGNCLCSKCPTAFQFNQKINKPKTLAQIDHQPSGQSIGFFSFCSPSKSLRFGPKLGRSHWLALVVAWLLLLLLLLSLVYAASKFVYLLFGLHRGHGYKQIQRVAMETVTENNCHHVDRVTGMRFCILCVVSFASSSYSSFAARLILPMSAICCPSAITITWGEQSKVGNTK